MPEISAWDPSANNNTSSPPDGAPEGMAYSAVNNVIREVMAVIARYYRDNNSSIVSTGSANVIQVTTSGTYTYVEGLLLMFVAGNSNSSAATFQITGLATTSLTRTDGSALRRGDVISGQVYWVRYNASSARWELLNPSAKRELYIEGTETADPDLTDVQVALIAGTFSGQHIEIGAAAIQSKTSATAAGTLTLQNNGGILNLGGVAPVGATNRVQVFAAQGTRSPVRHNAVLTASSDPSRDIGAAEDEGLFITNSNGSATFNLIDDADLVGGAQFTVLNAGAGDLSITVASGVTFDIFNGTNYDAAQTSGTLVSGGWMIVTKLSTIPSTYRVFGSGLS